MITIIKMCAGCQNVFCHTLYSDLLLPCRQCVTHAWSQELQHTATHCNTLQHSATHGILLHCIVCIFSHPTHLFEKGLGILDAHRQHQYDVVQDRAPPFQGTAEDVRLLRRLVVELQTYTHTHTRTWTHTYTHFKGLQKMCVRPSALVWSWRRLSNVKLSHLTTQFPVQNNSSADVWGLSCDLAL